MILLGLFKISWAAILIAFDDSACIACRIKFFAEGDYKCLIFPGKGTVFHLYRFIIHQPSQLVNAIVAITGKRFVEAVIPVIDWRGKTIFDRLDFLNPAHPVLCTILFCAT